METEQTIEQTPKLLEAFYCDFYFLDTPSDNRLPFVEDLLTLELTINILLKDFWLHGCDSLHPCQILLVLKYIFPKCINDVY